MTAVVDGLAVADPHRSQFDGSPLAKQNCTPDTVANGANTVTAAQVSVTGGHVRALLERWEETDPDTPGWSIPDAVKGTRRLGEEQHVALNLIDRTGDGWSAAITAVDAHYYVLVQGDSDQFPTGCSAKYDGPHCIGFGPQKRILNGLRQRWTNDPICGTGRWEYEYILRRYATKLNASIRFAVFTPKVPTPTALTPLQKLVTRVTFLRLHEPAAARRWKKAHPLPSHETTADRTARLTAEINYLTKARITRLVPLVKSLRRHHPAVAKAYRKKHPIPSTETLGHRADRLTAEILWLRAH